MHAQVRCDHAKNKLPNCPICTLRESRFSMQKTQIKDHFYGSSPAPFIGRFNYPNINVGILSPQHQSDSNWIYDAPKHWAKERFDIAKISSLRTELVNSRFKADVNRPEKMLDIAQAVGMASKPVDIEVKLKDRPVFSTSFDGFLAPMGPKAIIQKADMTSNPKVHTKVYKVSEDIDLKATESINYLYKNSFDENMLSKILSVGAIGVKTDRRLVPTRWSITAVDDMIGKNLREKITDFNEIELRAYFGGYLGNYYMFLFFPGPWSYEIFEMYADGKTPLPVYSTDNESYKGRKDYAHETAGGYYAPRLAVLEHLVNMKRKGMVIALRFITDEYTNPLGVWVTREASRESLRSSPILFSSAELMLRYCELLSKRRFGVDISYLLKKSKVLISMTNQKKLSDF